MTARYFSLAPPPPLLAALCRLSASLACDGGAPAALAAPRPAVVNVLSGLPAAASCDLRVSCTLLGRRVAHSELAFETVRETAPLAEMDLGDVALSGEPLLAFASACFALCVFVCILVAIARELFVLSRVRRDLRASLLDSF